MKVVSRFEANLLRILYFFLGRVPAPQAVPLVLAPCPRPKCLGRAAVGLVQEALAKGCVLFLARAGGWRPEAYLRGGAAVTGRLWQRTPPRELGLSFSRNALRFLIWVTAARPGEDKASWLSPKVKPTAGDLVLLYLAYAALRTTEAGGAFRQRPEFAGHGLCRLAFAEDFDAGGEPEPDFAPWTAGVGACVLEAVQPLLAERWREAERAKGQTSDWREMQRLGGAQERVLVPFLKAADAAGRRDLAQFVLATAADLLGEDAAAGHWVGGLRGAGPRLADRAETYRRALAFLRQLDVLRQWDRQARGVGYFDDGYRAAQFWKAEWERARGPELHARAQAVLRQLDPLKQT